MARYIDNLIKADLPKKLVLLSGPRQSGKTTLSKSLYPESSDYLNFDATSDRLQIQQQSWDRSKQLLILDELHKMPNWKQWKTRT